MITVFGSINLDLVVAVPRLPERGETVIGPDHQAFPGGKGANQALAARRAGAVVQMVGAVGQDAFATPALTGLDDAGVKLDTVRRLEGATGLAFIGVEASGENQIIVASGVNTRVSANWLQAMLTSEDILLMQGELPEAELISAIEFGRTADATIIWNPAPVPGQKCAALAGDVDVLVVNRGEAEELAALLGLPSEPEAFASAFSQNDVLVVVTMGADGIYAGKVPQRFRIKAPAVDVHDTTGAGDAFCGALAAAIDRGDQTEAALKQAVAAGSLACTVTGAQSSAPSQSDIQKLAAEL
ncbi:ribokinase [Roseibium polysiphoniae]|uniref:Ribokinase n=1 Tax=Roseibium polysiphoniae TaxID=2571221 RepID=A0A944CHP3_9HYPH|nr:ribokinase [Roseibium polysiphoniae]MBS8262486.1 ribokinase [Roseibium polysiphoniae]